MPVSRNSKKKKKKQFIELKRVSVIDNKGNVLNVKVMNADQLEINKKLIAEVGDKAVNKLSVTNTSRKIV